MYAALRHHIGQKALCHFFGGWLHIGVTPQQLLETRHLIGQITASLFVTANGMLSQINCAGTWGGAGRFGRGGGAQMLDFASKTICLFASKYKTILEL